ncbi:MAG: hydroxymethylbilane synthase [Deltaproteobacteria bacterium CG_4_10_14_0_2_um_filter_43_8]|nr:MAG: hydroxymethylbilane synthase [Deltaproteobacteria bacterium CG11_big_fil_rev_8_21_14_0_20_42_23]PJA20199.1 MAG: hydroxymethylbilane synthase [Deltaproteobacteria bacterium CG_4_10_14_0_2_um_filter_43_8]PJC64334.1 MAG: hydroxymethylbilane synthase [Deltaproteobacteria bacterium CG_4_9_14_0_2_um_filter_42_21]
MNIVLGTRKSKLALSQSNWVAGLLRAAGAHVRLKEIVTTGDVKLETKLADIGGKGLFVKEIEEAMLAGEIDLAVHSMKDVPAGFPDGLQIIAIPQREDVRDVLVCTHAHSFASLAKGAVVGTSSPRRECLLREYYPHLKIVAMRGNVDTRLKKLEAGEVDALVLAAAGLHRLNLTEKITAYLDPFEMIPAVGQGALALEARQDDLELISFVHTCLHDEHTALAVESERAVLRTVSGDCHTPLGVFSECDAEAITLHAFLGTEKGIVKKSAKAPLQEALQLGEKIGKQLLAG